MYKSDVLHYKNPSKGDYVCDISPHLSFLQSASLSDSIVFEELIFIVSPYSYFVSVNGR